jgi:hypothetical protein
MRHCEDVVGVASVPLSRNWDNPVSIKILEIEMIFGRFILL